MRVYFLLHIAGIMLLFSGLSGTLLAHYGAVTTVNQRSRVLAATCHGLGLLLILASGILMLHELGTGGMPGWAWGKLVILVLLGGAIPLARKKSEMAWTLLAIFILLGVMAGYLALYKPF